MEAAWGIIANHGGGYSYRLCKVPAEGMSGITEECFQVKGQKLLDHPLPKQKGISVFHFDSLPRDNTEINVPAKHSFGQIFVYPA